MIKINFRLFFLHYVIFGFALCESKTFLTGKWVTVFIWHWDWNWSGSKNKTWYRCWKWSKA